MAGDTEGSTGFSRNLAKALSYLGVGLLSQPDRLLVILSDTVQDDPALETLRQNCTTELLAPFYSLLCQNQVVPHDEIQEAASDAEAYLVQERYIEQPAAHLLCAQLASGVSSYVLSNPSLASAPDTGTDTGSDADTDNDSADSSVPSNRQPQLKRILLVASALALVVAAAIVLFMRVTVSFDGNGSTSGDMRPVRVWKDREWTVPACQYSKSSYAFLGWELNGRTYRPNDTLTILQQCTLRAMWGAEVSFDANGGSGHMDTLAANEDGAFSLPTCDFYRSDYDFAGWTPTRHSWSDDPEVLESGSSVTVDGPATYYAIWAPLATFDPNGASGSMDALRISPSGTVTLPENEFTRSGYRFIGWSKSEDGRRASPGKTVSADGPTTFYAVWRPLASFDANGGSGSMDDQAAKKGGKLVLPKNGFTRSGYRFAGWATSKSGKPTSPGETVTIDSPTTYYAIWRAGVTFKGNGADSGSTATVYADDSNMVTLPECGFSRAGYVFLGWGEEANATSFWHPGNHISASEPRTLYALWKIDPNIIDKVSHNCTFKDWESGGSSLFVYFTNNSPIPLRLNVTFDYYDGSDSQIDESEDTVTTIASGETTLLVGSSDKSGIHRIGYTFSAQAPDSGYNPIQGTYRVRETTCEAGRLVLRIDNTSSKAITINRVTGYGYDGWGGESYFVRYPRAHLNPGESLEVSCIAGDYDWPGRTRVYYVDGYAG